MMSMLMTRLLVLLLLCTADATPPVRKPALVIAPARPASAAISGLRTAGDLKRHLLRCKSRKDWESASSTLWWALEEMGEEIEPMHFNVVISTLAAARPTPEWERAITLLDQMPSAGLRPDEFSYSAAITACSRAGQVERALAIFKQCSADHAAGPNSIVFNAMLAACQRGGSQWRPQLLALFASMSAHGVRPDAWAHSAAIDALSKTGEWKRALELVADLEQGGGGEGTRPDSHVYGAAMRACLRVRQWSSVLDLHERMLRAKVAPTSHTLASALSACAADPEGLGWQRAQQIVLREKRAAAAAEGATPMNVHCYTAAARAYASAGRWEEAQALLVDMRDAGVQPNAHTYTAVISSFKEAGLWRPALAILRGMTRVGVPADSHAVHAALQVVGRAGECEQAVELVRSMRAEHGVPPTPVHATTCLGILLADGRLEEAESVLKELLEEQGVRPDAGLCDVALGVCSRTGAWQLTLDLLEVARSDGLTLTPRMRRCAVVALCRAGQWEQATELLPPLPPVAHGGAPDEEGATCRKAVVIAMKRSGAERRAADLVREAREHGMDI